MKNKTKMSSAGVEGKYSLFTEEKVQLLKHLTRAEFSNEVKAAVPEEVAVHEEELQTKQRSPITILSDDEVEGSRRSLCTKQIKISIQLSFHDIFLSCICLYLVNVLCIIECLP